MVHLASNSCLWRQQGHSSNGCCYPSFETLRWQVYRHRLASWVTGWILFQQHGLCISHQRCPSIGNGKGCSMLWKQTVTVMTTRICSLPGSAFLSLLAFRQCLADIWRV